MVWLHIISGNLKCLVSKPWHHINNAQDVIEQSKDITRGPWECIISHDVTALFTSVPEVIALKVVQDKLDQDQELHLRS